MYKISVILNIVIMMNLSDCSIHCVGIRNFLVSFANNQDYCKGCLQTVLNMRNWCCRAFLYYAV